MRPGQAVGHVAEEGGDLGGDAGFQIDLAGGFQRLGARLLLHLQAAADGLGQGRQGAGRGLGQDAGALAAAGDEDMDRAIGGGRDIGPVEQGSDVGADRIADEPGPGLYLGRRAAQGREGRSHRADRRGQHAVGAAQDGVLFMDQGRAARGHGGDQGRGRRIAAEAHDHVRADAGEGGLRLPHPLEDGQARLQQADGAAAGRGVQRQTFLGGKGVGVLLAARIGGQHHAPAARGQFAGQGLGGEHMAASAPGGDDADLVHGNSLTAAGDGAAGRCWSPAHRPPDDAASGPAQTPWSGPWPSSTSRHS